MRSTSNIALYFVSILCTDLFHVTSAGNLQFSDYFILFELYNNTKGSIWRWSGIPWNFTGILNGIENNPCLENWDGIVCSKPCFSDDVDEPCFVSQLNLTNHSLTGYIPENFWNLTNVSVVYLNDNELMGGNFTRGICQAKNIEILDLSFNLMTSSIPTCLTNLKELKSLDLNNNLMSGNLPEIAFESLPKLLYLNILGNNFHGIIPSSAWSGSTSIVR